MPAFAGQNLRIVRIFQEMLFRAVVPYHLCIYHLKATFLLVSVMSLSSYIFEDSDGMDALLSHISYARAHRREKSRFSPASSHVKSRALLRCLCLSVSRVEGKSPCSSPVRRDRIEF